MDHNQLRDISLGGLAAENDNYLENYFFETSMYRRVKLGHTKILIGNRGSGKSAIFKMLAKFEIEAGNLVQEIIPSDYLYDLLRNTRHYDSNAVWARLGAYTASWKYVILMTAMSLLYDKFKDTKKKDENVECIKSFLKENSDEYDKSPIDLLVDLLKKFASISKVSMDGVEFEEQTKQMDKLYKLEKLKHVIPAILMLSNASKITILFDELDHGWDSSDDSRQFIAGLFKAAVFVNQNFPNINVLITIREEIYQNIPELYEDAQKIRDMIEYLRWTPLELKTMITRRIQHSLNWVLETKLKENNEEKTWTNIFYKNLDNLNQASFEYILDRTLYRPRELIFFINECFKIHNLEEKIGESTIHSVEKIYSGVRFQDIASEFRFQYPGLDEVFETFRGSRIHWTLAELEEHWLDIMEGEKRCPKAECWLKEMVSPEKLIKALWQVGFLKANVNSTKQESQNDKNYLGYYQEPTLNISLVQNFAIHPMYYSHLGI